MHTHRAASRLRVAVTAIFFLLLLVPTPTCAQVIKVAMITPEGSAWTQALHRLAREVRHQTDGDVRFKIFAGGISGDELDVLRKMRINRIHAAGFSGVGLGAILPETRILEAPLLFRSYAEIDHVKEQLFEEFAAGFRKKGFELLGFAEAGFVYFFSQKPLAGKSQLESQKMWVWRGDPVAQTTLSAFNVNTVPLHLSDVLTGLETGMIDAYYAPPLAAVSFQWHTKIDYLLDYPVVNSTGALLIKSQMFNRLSTENQKILRQLSRQFCAELVRIARQQNDEALALLKEMEIEFQEPPQNQMDTFSAGSASVYEANIPDLYPRSLFDRVQAMLTRLRAG